MNIEEIRDYCLSFKGVTEDIKWGHHLCFCVGGKIFFIGSMDETPFRASIKVSDEEFETLTMREGIIAAPYMARNKWIKAEEGAFSDKEWKLYLKNSYEYIKSKLTKKLRKELS